MRPYNVNPRKDKRLFRRAYMKPRKYNALTNNRGGRPL